MYDPKSMCADDFIDHQEILDTLSYAEQHKSDAVLIDSIIEKAKERKGLSHREASVLLACDIEEKNQEIYALAEQIKKDFYGNRIVMMHQGADILDRRNGEKAATRVEDLLGLFNEISIECGN